MFVRVKLFGWIWGKCSSLFVFFSVWFYGCNLGIVIGTTSERWLCMSSFYWGSMILWSNCCIRLRDTCAYPVLSLDKFLITRAIWVVTFMVVLWLLCFMVVVLNGIGSRVVLSPVCYFKLILWVRHGELFLVNTYIYIHILHARIVVVCICAVSC